ncbi:uncharacterized protein BO80DRAFT_160954 [Aspergillus ibericus CBS 121593]|uniref:Uncharacterized protein n=1 Tax=Aspergillus ibericus CBS 121593 TaxID=1448316 RepID=A0A395GTT4_9EURO|nr:hypothetical protein BO80DRAFT_160954 [Aspergillus ibericus CBS 121593]RAK98368.1 hypothetical protein BO80DRAFT_160954 [Aspergillus ibericus CBS 121593]
MWSTEYREQPMHLGCLFPASYMVDSTTLAGDYLRRASDPVLSSNTRLTPRECGRFRWGASQQRQLQPARAATVAGCPTIPLERFGGRDRELSGDTPWASLQEPALPCCLFTACYYSSSPSEHTCLVPHPQQDLVSASPIDPLDHHWKRLCRVWFIN